MVFLLLKNTLRTLLNHPLKLAISLFALVASFFALFLIIQFSHQELSYDNYHADASNIYRIETIIHDQSHTTFSAQSILGLGMYAKDAFPEIRNACSSLMNLADWSQVSREKEGTLKTVKVNYYHTVTPSIFEVFSFQVLEGSLEGALEKPNTSVITKSLRDKLFTPSENAVGSVISINNGGIRDAEVLAVVDDLPENSHFKVELLEPMIQFETDYPEIYRNSMWSWLNRYNYLRVLPSTDLNQLETKLNSMLDERRGQQTEERDLDVILTPILDIHLKSNKLNEHEPNGDLSSIYGLWTIGALILIVLVSNLIGLNLSTSLSRAKMTGMKKCLGSSLRILWFLGFMESFLTIILSVFFAWMLLHLIEPSIHQIFTSFPRFYLLSLSWFWLGTTFFSLSLAIIVSTYPTLLLAKQNTLDLLKGKFHRSPHGSRIMNGLTITQFTLTSILIALTMVVNRQFNFLFDQEVGAVIDETIVLKAPPVTSEDPSQHFNLFRDIIMDNAMADEVSFSTSVPGAPLLNSTVRLLETAVNQSIQVNIVSADANYSNLYQLDFVAGRGYDPDRTTDYGRSVIVNEQLAQSLGFEEPENAIGNPVIHNVDTLRIIGVVNNYFHRSAKEAIGPMIISLNPRYSRFGSLKISTTNFQETIQKIEETWNDVFPGTLFDYFFLTSRYKQQYQQEAELNWIAQGLSLLSIIIACAGLFAISMHRSQIRVKEIAIKKVLGARASLLFWELSSSLIISIVVTMVLISPFSYYLSSLWLNNYAYRISFQGEFILIPMALVLVFSVLTMSYHLNKTISKNPSTILQDE